MIKNKQKIDSRLKSTKFDFFFFFEYSGYSRKVDEVQNHNLGQQSMTDSPTLVMNLLCN